MRTTRRQPGRTRSKERTAHRSAERGGFPQGLIASGFLPALAAATGTGAVLWSGGSTLAACAAAALATLATVRVLHRRAAPTHAELTTRESATELLQVIVDATPDAVLFFSDLGVIRYANAGARELFFEGAHPEGENFIHLAARAPAALREALLGDSDRLFSVEVEGRHETYHVSRRSFPLEGEDHTILAVKHLTREIARREVDVLKQVVRIISHEVNNSLAPVSSLVHSARVIAKNPADTAKLPLVFDTIEERTTHLREFLEGYAALARLPQPRRRSVEADRFVHQLGLLHAEVRLGEPPSEPGWFDPAQIEQVVINLVKNAREAGSSPGDIEISLETKPGGESNLEIRDRGPGFSNEALQSALLPLYSTKERGSGMGLALSREIVDAHGGSLIIANREGGGAVVRVKLPGRIEPSPILSRSRLTLGR